MKNLFKSVSASGNPAKFVWQNNSFASRSRDEDVKEAARNLEKERVDVEKAEAEKLYASMAEGQAKINMEGYNNEVKRINKKRGTEMSVLTAKLLNDRGLIKITNQYISEENFEKKYEKMVEKFKKNVETINEKYDLQIDAAGEKYSQEISKMKSTKERAHRAAENYTAELEDFAIAEEALKEASEMVTHPISTHEEIVAEQTARFKLNNEKVLEAKVSNNSSFSSAEIGNSAYEMMKNIPGKKRQEAFRANFPELDDDKYKYGRGLTAEGNKMLYDTLKSRLN